MKNSADPLMQPARRAYLDSEKNTTNLPGFARILRAKLEAKESQRAPLVNGCLGCLGTEIPGTSLSIQSNLDRYEDAWKWVALWLQRQRIHAPRQLTYKLEVEYVDFRTHFKKRTGKTVGRNTAILELKMLWLVMGEAVRLGQSGSGVFMDIFAWDQ